MTRLLFWAAPVALAAALAGCGPDCQGYCSKLAECAREGLRPAVDEGNCLLACNQTSGDNARIIGCVNSHTCPQIFQAGDCSVTGRP